jgi:hypothetical protein
MQIALRSLVLLQSPLAWVNAQPMCPAIVTAVWPGADGNTDSAIGPVRVDVLAFPNGGVPRSVQQVRVFDLRSQVGNDDLHGVAFVTDDIGGYQEMPRPQSIPPIRRETADASVEHQQV